MIIWFRSLKGQTSRTQAWCFSTLSNSEPSGATSCSTLRARSINPNLKSALNISHKTFRTNNNSKTVSYQRILSKKTKTVKSYTNAFKILSTRPFNTWTCKCDLISLIIFLKIYSSFAMSIFIWLEEKILK